MVTVPWLAPVGLPPRDFDAALFRTMLWMRLVPSGRHWERCYRITSAWLELYDSMRGEG